MSGSESPGERPTPLQYRSELVAILADLQGVWDSPRFQSGIAHSRRRDFGAIEVRILWTLARRGPLRSSALAQLLVTGAPSISKAIVKLTASGLVRRDVDATDGRAHSIALTTTGVAAAQDLYDAGDDMMAELLADWPADEAADFTRFARRFLDQTISYATRLP